MTLKCCSEKMSRQTGHTLQPYFEKAMQEDFVRLYHEAIGEIRRNPVAGALLGEVEQAGKVVEVYRSIDGCPWNATWAEATKAGSYQPIAEPKDLSAALLKAKPRSTVERLRKLAEKHAEQIQWGAPSDVEVKSIKWKPDAAKRQKYLMCELERFDCLVPSEGVDCKIRWHPTNAFVGDPKALDKDAPKNKWRTRPPWIGLAHELVHAWRFACGRVIFDGEKEHAEDEDLATGVHREYVAWGKYSENSVRYHAFLPARLIYGTDVGG